MECESDEYEEYKRIVSTLTSDEARTELLDCARYGEIDSVRALLEHFHSRETSIINCVDKAGSTPLHKACANGHVNVSRLLVDSGAILLRNHSGNTPLHWAAAGGHEECVELLLGRYTANTADRISSTPDIDFSDSSSNVSVYSLLNVRNSYGIDVLEKNNFGRSALTEGFSSSNTKVVGLLLEHVSATEDRLIGGSSDCKANKCNEGVANYTDVEVTTEKDDIVSQEVTNIVHPRVVIETTNAEKKKISTRRISNNEVCDISESDMTATSTDQGIIHEFDFNVPSRDCCSLAIVDKGELKMDHNVTEVDNDNTVVALRVRELPIANADNPFGVNPSQDTTGYGIWCASLVMARWMASLTMTLRFDGKTVLELGSGCGIPGLAAALYSQADKVYLSDLNKNTIDNLTYNIELNNTALLRHKKIKNSRVEAIALDWDDEGTWPMGKIDYIIGSDLIYQRSVVPLLKKVVAGLLPQRSATAEEDNGFFLYVAPDNGRNGLSEFVTEMKLTGFDCVYERMAPDEFRQNPLMSGDEEDCFLHFHELAVKNYVMYEFQRTR